MCVCVSVAFAVCSFGKMSICKLFMMGFLFNNNMYSDVYYLFQFVVSQKKRSKKTILLFVEICYSGSFFKELFVFNNKAFFLDIYYQLLKFILALKKKVKHCIYVYSNILTEQRVIKEKDAFSSSLCSKTFS